mmetsp:Transcript_42111/g.86024  ORF Transcript_42111/g.86024 Transcript_42111/m.86024 type:complete len:302 (-) Transcript_42111:235-1140(-)
MSADVGFLQLLTPNATSCSLHPLVMFEVLDHYTRRNAEDGRVVGALLGSVNSDGSLVLKNSFPLPHDDPSHQDFAVFFNTMSELHHRVNPREHVVGWYTTTKAGDSDAAKEEVGEEDVACHAFFEDKIGDKYPCVLLRVDGNIQSATKMGVSAFVSSPMSLRAGVQAPEVSLGKCFSRIQCNIRAYEAERIGVDFITQNTIGQGGGEVLGTDLEKLESAVMKLIMMIESSIEHVDHVIAGEAKGDTRVGRCLGEAVSSVPEMTPGEFEASMSKGLQDLLMVHYLGAITQSQICFMQRLQSM